MGVARRLGEEGDFAMNCEWDWCRFHPVHTYLCTFTAQSLSSMSDCCCEGVVALGRKSLFPATLQGSMARCAKLCSSAIAVPRALHFALDDIWLFVRNSTMVSGQSLINHRRSPIFLSIYTRFLQTLLRLPRDLSFMNAPFRVIQCSKVQIDG